MTGAARGIGLATARRFCEEGASVALSDVLEVEGAASDRAVDETLRLGGGRIDVLLGNAGIVFGGAIEHTPEPAFLELLEVNLTSLFRTSRACFGPMRDQGGGSMIHLASDSGIRGVHEIPAYSVTKAGVIAVSELFAAEGAPFGVRANAVCPGDVTPGIQATPEGHGEHAEDPSGWTLPPSGRFGTGEDVAALVAWLASDESSHVTGATLRIDGGMGAAMSAHTRS